MSPSEKLSTAFEQDVKEACAAYQRNELDEHGFVEQVINARNRLDLARLEPYVEPRSPTIPDHS